MTDYYKTCPFPKPGSTKKKKKVNGYRDKAKRHCFYTGLPNAERHELFYGSGTRQVSVDHGLQVDLHPPLDWAAKEQHRLRKEAQEKWELKIRAEMGLSEKDARLAWVELVGGSCLD